MQRIHIVVGNDIVHVDLPSPASEWAPGLHWGDASFLLTPAWIAKHAHMRWRQGTYAEMFGSAQSGLAQELVFCILSGFGVKAEVAVAAFDALSHAGLFEGKLDHQQIESILLQPVRLPTGKMVRYRFPRMRAAYLHDALLQIDELSLIDEGLALRDRLLAIRGIGQKTASFIVRNHLKSDDVAILDIHVLRAGVIARIFPEAINIARDYQALEARFLSFARAAGVPASILDMTLWELMRTIPAHRLEAAARLNEALATIEAGSVPQYDPCQFDRIDSEGAGADGRKQQEKLFVGNAL